MISIGVLGTARVVPYGLLAPAKETRGVEVNGIASSCPVLVNTSFKVRGEPIACMPEDAFRCLMGAEIKGWRLATVCSARSDRIRR
jgi:hypothetical protein